MAVRGTSMPRGTSALRRTAVAAIGLLALVVIRPAGAAAPTPPDPAHPLYGGPTFTIAVPVALCGVHEFDVLTVDARVNVATEADEADFQGTGPRCPAGSEGRLELRANTLVVNPQGSVTADGTSTDVPGVGPQFRATGSSGGTNAGVGFVGSAPDSGVGPYEPGTVDTNVFPGGPGSEVPFSYEDPDIDGPIPSAGPGGNGGGAIVLKADRSLIVAGTVSANGATGAGNATGACDTDEFEDPSNDLPIFDDEDPPNIIGFVRVSDDPPYEHTGFHGAGGGAGGGIALSARYTVDLAGATLSARGGNGGSGLLGAGGGGGGGVIKVIGPVQRGVSQSGLDAAATAGLNGATTACPGVDLPSVPVDDLGQAQETDGFGVVDARPTADLRPYGPFWWPGGGAGPFDGYYVGGGGDPEQPLSATLVTCAVELPTSTGPPDPTALTAVADARLPQQDPPVGTSPHVGDPCGEPSSGPSDAIQELSRSHRFSGAVIAPAPIPVDIDPTGYYGLYTTAIRPATAGNDCFSPLDDAILGVSSDVADCLVEVLTGVEWMIGVDADPPTVGRDPAADACSAPGDAGWCRGTQTAGFQAQDAASGLADPSLASFTRSSASEGQAVSIASGPVADAVGNVNAGIDAGPFQIDSTPPTVTCQSPAPQFLQGSSSRTVSATVTDGLSGPREGMVSAPADTATAGAKTVSLTGTDVAGNTTTALCAYLIVESVRTCSNTSLLFNGSCTVQLVCPAGGPACAATATAGVTAVPLTGLVTATAALQRTSPAATTTSSCRAIRTCRTTEGPRTMNPGSTTRATCTAGGIGVLFIVTDCRLGLTY